MVGALRESWRLTALATAALVVFTTVQSFAVFAQILEGAWLFVALGVVFLGTGFGFDRARRKLVEVVTDDRGDRTDEPPGGHRGRAGVAAAADRRARGRARGSPRTCAARST